MPYLSSPLQYVIEPSIPHHCTPVPSSLTISLQAPASAPAPKLPVPQEVRHQLLDIRERLNTPTEGLVSNAAPIRARYQEIEAFLPEALVDVLTPVAFMEYHRPQYVKAQRRMADRESHDALRASALEEQHRVDKLHEHYEALKAQPKEVLGRLEQLRKEKADLQAALEAKNKEIAAEELVLAQLAEEIDRQEAALSAAVDEASRRWDLVKDPPGSAEDDLYTLAQIDQIRMRAIFALDELL